MKRVILSVVFALPAPFVFILGAELFEVRGKNSITETLVGCIALALYLGYCQFWVAPKGSREFGAKWPTLGAMTATLLLMLVYMAFKEKMGTVLAQGIPMLVSGCLGSLVGAVVAGQMGQRPRREPQGMDM